MKLSELIKELNILKGLGHSDNEVLMYVEVSGHLQSGRVKEVRQIVDMVQLRCMEVEG